MQMVCIIIYKNVARVGAWADGLVTVGLEC
jgi:hypothetical protein